MGIIAVSEVTIDGDFSVDEKGNLKTSRRFLVEATLNALETEASDAVATAYGIHHLDPHPVNNRMRALTIQSKRVDALTLGWFYVSVMYDSKPTDDKSTSTDPQQDDQSVPPDQRPYLVSIDQTESQKLLAPKDMDTVNGPDGTPGAFVLNKAKTPFDPPPSVPLSCPLITIEGYKNVATLGPMNKANFYANSVNDGDYRLPGTFGTVKDGTGRITKYSIKQVYENSAYYYKFAIHIAIKADGWNPIRVLNAGCYYILSNSMPPMPIVINGKPVTKPVALKDDGSGPLPVNGVPNWCEFVGYRSQVWTGAGNLI